MISVVLAVHNEAHNLKRCLDSVKDWADEMIVVDGESTDDTAKLAKELGAKVISTTNKRNFHINKQMGMDKAKGDLVLQLDADEVVDEELARFIKDQHAKIAAHADDIPAAWWIKRKNWFMNRFLQKGGQYPDPVIRLYQKGKARLPQADVHEQMTVDGEVGWAEGHLLHYSNPRLKDYLRKFETYTTFKAHQLHEAQTSVSILAGLKYLVLMPASTFLSLYVRHKGFVDGVPGFLFAAFSGLHHAVAWLKLKELYAQSTR